MERVSARGHVNRKLVGVEVASDDVPAPETRLYAGDRDVGWVTSAARSWRVGAVIALAYVRREHLAPGTTLALGAAGGAPVTVRALPF
jgi:glycine cleavage system aminomethyltransferase T